MFFHLIMFLLVYCANIEHFFVIHTIMVKYFSRVLDFGPKLLIECTRCSQKSVVLLQFSIIVQTECRR